MSSNVNHYDVSYHRNYDGALIFNRTLHSPQPVLVRKALNKLFHTFSQSLSFSLSTPLLPQTMPSDDDLLQLIRTRFFLEIRTD